MGFKIAKRYKSEIPQTELHVDIVFYNRKAPTNSFCSF